jgi:hypothetical protein
MIHIAMMHVPRDVETLPEAYESVLDKFTHTEVFISVDGPHDIGTGGHTMLVEKYVSQLGCFKHYARTLRELVNGSKDGDIVGVLPDDLVFKYNIEVQKTIEQALNPDLVGYCAVYTPRELGRRNKWKNGGWQPVAGGWDSSYGGGYFFRREVAQKVLEHPFFINHRDNYEANQQIDHCIPQVMHELGLKQLFHVPSLSKHIGMTSTIGHVHTEAEDAWGWK